MRAKDWRAEYEALLVSGNLGEFDDYSDIAANDLRHKTPEEEINEAIDKAIESTSLTPFSEMIPKELVVEDLKLFRRPRTQTDHKRVRCALDQITDSIKKQALQSTLDTCWSIPLKAELDVDLLTAKKGLTMFDADVASKASVKGQQHSVPEGAPPCDTSSSLAVQATEVILTFQIRSSNQINVVHAELELLGCHTLFDLHNHLYCVHKHLRSPNVPTNPFFFIEGYFYMHPHASKADIDAVSAILDWVDSPEVKVSSFTFKPNKAIDSVTPVIRVDASKESRIRWQHEARLDDMDLSIGARYLYCHEWGCEHFVYLTEIRAFHPRRDPLTVDAYPRLTQHSRMRRRKCGVCKVLTAQFVVYDDRLASKNPTFFCQHCYHCLHYTAEGALIYGDFCVFDYLHDME